MKGKIGSYISLHRPNRPAGSKSQWVTDFWQRMATKQSRSIGENHKCTIF